MVAFSRTVENSQPHWFYVLVLLLNRLFSTLARTTAVLSHMEWSVFTQPVNILLNKKSKKI